MPWPSGWLELSPAKFSPKPDFPKRWTGGRVAGDFVSHLEEFRRRLITCLIIFAAATFAAYFFARPILDWLTWPLRQYGVTNLYFQKPHEAFFIYMKTAGFTGLFFSLPFLFYQLWCFVSPGLYDNEKKFILPLVLISTALFLCGALFGYYFVIPVGLGFLLSFQTESLKPILDVAAYFSFLTGMLLAFGVLFDFPVVVIGLVRLGVVKTAGLKKARRLVIVLIFAAAAILTPSPDPVSQLLLAFPLVFLFEISLWIAAMMEKRGGVDTPAV